MLEGKDGPDRERYKVQQTADNNVCEICTAYKMQE